MRKQLKHKAMIHWQEWLPIKWAELVAEDRVDEALNQAARAAEKEIRQLMAQGARLDEAEEIVLPTWILLPPEPEPEDDWMAKEIAEMEDVYQSRMAAEMKMTRDMEEHEDTPQELQEWMERMALKRSQAK